MTYSRLKAVFENEPSPAPQKVSGKWFPIRFTPDAATGELFNIGVGFIEDGKHKNRLHIKILESARSFKCLYGSVGVENFTFLLTIVGEHLRSTQKIESPSPQISFGSKAFACGESPDAILGRLFNSVVSLRRHFEEAVEDLSSNSISSIEAREEICTELYKRTPTLAASLVRKEPFLVKTHAGRDINLDIPLRREKRFGTIASAHYRKEVYVSNNLNMAMRDMLITREHAEESDDCGGIFILRAPTDGRHFTESWQRWIDEEIEKVRETLFHTNIQVREGSSVGQVCDEIRDWAQ